MKRETFFTDFVEFVQNPLHSPLNRKFYWNADENIYDLFTDGYNLNDDKDFLRCCSDLITMYLKKCCSEGHSYAEVLACREDLSNIKKRRQYFPGKFDFAVSLDPKEVYYSKKEVEEYFNM